MEGNSIQLMSNYVGQAKNIKPTFTQLKEVEKASQLYGMDLVNKDKSVITKGQTSPLS